MGNNALSQTQVRHPRLTPIHTIASGIWKGAQWLGAGLIVTIITGLIANMLATSWSTVTTSVVYNMVSWLGSGEPWLLRVASDVALILILGLILLSGILTNLLQGYKKLSRAEKEQREQEEQKNKKLEEALRSLQELADQQSKEDLEAKNQQAAHQESDRKAFQRLLNRIDKAYNTIELPGIVFESPILLPTTLPTLEVFQTPYVVDDIPLYDAPGEQRRRGSYLARNANVDVQASQNYAQALQSVWQSQVKRNTRLEELPFTDVLQRLTYARPLAVILGAPGSGKSMLLRWLALRMVHASLNSTVTLPAELMPVQTPILVSLHEYAEKLQGGNLPLKEYISTNADTGYVNTIVAVREKLEQGLCLILLDGLDEISSIALRRRVVEAIRILVTSPGERSGYSVRFNRFVLTSRIIGYEQGKLSHYPHYTLLDLKQKQIKQFLTGWLTTLQNNRVTQVLPSQYARNDTKRLASQSPEYILDLCKQMPGLASLAVNPQMLTLLLSFSVSGKDLIYAHSRLELYAEVASMLLRPRNGLDATALPYPEDAALINELLGNLSFRLHRRSFPVVALTYREIHLITRRTLAVRNRSRMREVKESEIAQTIEAIRQRSGIVVKVGNDLFCLACLTLQQYFVGLYLQRMPPEQFQRFFLSHYYLAHWREPLLFAIASKSRKMRNKEQREVNGLFRSLLMLENEYDGALHTHLLFAIDLVVAQQDCQYIDLALQRELLHQLFEIYGDPLQKGRYTTLQREIQSKVLAWLDAPSVRNAQGNVVPAILEIWQEVLSNTNVTSSARLEGALRLLADIAPQIDGHAPSIFHILIPSLTEIVGLRTLQDFPCPPEITTSPYTSQQKIGSSHLEEFAHIAARKLGLNGPSHWLHTAWIEWHHQQPALLERLSDHSFALNCLLSPAAPPWNASSTSPDEQVSNWQNMPQSSLPALQLSLLTRTDRAQYPAAYIYRQLLLYELSLPTLQWYESWDRFLKQEMQAGRRSTYHVCLRLRLLLANKDKRQYQRLASELEAALYARDTQLRPQKILALNAIAHLYLPDNSQEGKALLTLLAPLWADDSDIDFLQDTVGMTQYREHKSTLCKTLDLKTIASYLCDILVTHPRPVPPQDVLLALYSISAFQRPVSSPLSRLVLNSIDAFNKQQKQSSPIYRLLVTVIIGQVSGLSGLRLDNASENLDVDTIVKQLEDLSNTTNLQAKDIKQIFLAFADTRSIPPGIPTTSRTVREMAWQVMGRSFVLEPTAIDEILDVLVSQKPFIVEAAVKLLRQNRIPRLKSQEVEQRLQHMLSNEYAFFPHALTRVLGYPRVSDLYNRLCKILKSLVEESYAEM